MQNSRDIFIDPDTVYENSDKIMALAFCNQIPTKYSDSNHTEFSKKYSAALVLVHILNLSELSDWLPVFDCPEDTQEARVNEVLRMTLIGLLHAYEIKEIRKAYVACMMDSPTVLRNKLEGMNRIAGLVMGTARMCNHCSDIYTITGV